MEARARSESMRTGGLQLLPYSGVLDLGLMLEQEDLKG